MFDDHQYWPPAQDLSFPPTFVFSPPTFNDDALHDILLASHLQSPTHIPSPNPSQSVKIANADPPTKNSHSVVCRRKRAMRKDRHSKINTAQGPRDRRMRLSLDVARDFFDLQDTLGYDKASKTMKWLLTMSASAITDLMDRSRQQAVSQSSTSECNNNSADNKGKSHLEENTSSAQKFKREAATAAVRRVAPFATLAKESRAKARERARERTKEKKRNQQGYHDYNNKPSQHEASSFESIEGESVTEMEERCSSHHQQCGRPIVESTSKPPVAGLGFDNLMVNNQDFIDYHTAMSLYQYHRQCEKEMRAFSFQESDPAYFDLLARSWETLSSNQNPLFM